MSKALKLAPIDVDGANNTAASEFSEMQNVLGPLSPSAIPFTPRFSMVSRKSFTSEDYTREPEEAEGLEFRNVVPGQVTMVGVAEKGRLKRVVAGRGGNQDLEEPNKNGEPAEKTEAINAEISVNGN